MSVAKGIAQFQMQFSKACAAFEGLKRFQPALISSCPDTTLEGMGFTPVDAQELILALTDELKVDLSGPGEDLLPMTMAGLHQHCLHKDAEEVASQHEKAARKAAAEQASE